MSYGRTINIKEFMKILDSGDKILNSEYEAIFQSFAKRVEYSDIYFQAYIEMANPDAILHDFKTDLARGDEQVVNYRLYYEANALAFLQNIHALCDSTPYAINKIILHDKTDNYVKWDKNFIAGVRRKIPKQKDFIFSLVKFMRNDDFLRLKAYVNKAKHSHLVKVCNNGSELKFSEFSYPLYNAKKENGVAENEKVEEFMLRMHENLIGELIKIYNYMYHII